MFQTAANGTGDPTLFYSDPARRLVPSSVTPDGRALLVTGLSVSESRGGFDLGSLPLEGEPQWQTLEQRFNEIYPEVSPGGQWLAYVSNETGRFGIIVQSYPNLDARKLLIPGYANEFAWSRHGSELFYREEREEGERLMMAVPIDPDPASPEPVGEPEKLFEDTYLNSEVGRHFDIAPNGKFLMLKGSDGMVAPRHISVGLNWAEVLKERVPVN